MERIKKINLEEEKLTVDEALATVELEINSLNLQKQVKVLKIIHGYGSSGKGGEIKKNLPFLLLKLKQQGKILDYVQNSNFGSLSKKYKTFSSLYPELILDKDLSNLNPGISIVFLK